MSDGNSEDSSGKFVVPPIHYTMFQQKAEALINLIDRVLDHWRAAEVDQREQLWSEYERAWQELQTLIWTDGGEKERVIDAG